MHVPSGRTARVDILVEGSLTSTGGGVASSCTLIRDADRVIVVDPGMAESARSILDPIAALGVRPEDVTEVVLGHHHPDHTIHAGHFPNAAIHDHWAIYRGTDWEDSDCDGRVLAPSVVLARTPGHTPEDLAVVVGTPDGIVVCTHSWFNAQTTVEDESPEDPDALHASRAAILEVADLIIPGHGPAFRPTPETPR
ncbi:MAG TPA: MBL fold metallo-hydrolase [Candidatus Binatia bacterium]|nr:MBL fold metallo-hydrolase [Candidatus Binatia bacterium]